MAGCAGQPVNHAALEPRLRFKGRRLELHGCYPVSRLLIQGNQEVARFMEFRVLFHCDFETFDGVRVLANPMIRQSQMIMRRGEKEFQSDRGPG